jgi:hypothetical protein
MAVHARVYERDRQIFTIRVLGRVRIDSGREQLGGASEIAILASACQRTQSRRQTSPQEQVKHIALGKRRGRPQALRMERMRHLIEQPPHRIDSTAPPRSHHHLGQEDA